jgi:hypothetical protein
MPPQLLEEQLVIQHGQEEFQRNHGLLDRRFGNACIVPNGLTPYKLTEAEEDRLGPVDYRCPGLSARRFTSTGQPTAPIHATRARRLTTTCMRDTAAVIAVSQRTAPGTLKRAVELARSVGYRESATFARRRAMPIHT